MSPRVSKSDPCAFSRCALLRPKVVSSCRHAVRQRQKCSDRRRLCHEAPECWELRCTRCRSCCTGLEFFAFTLDCRRHITAPASPGNRRWIFIEGRLSVPIEGGDGSLEALCFMPSSR